MTVSLISVAYTLIPEAATLLAERLSPWLQPQ
ncbi:MAG: hypothetical protein ACI9T9_002499, partial [Oleiphilaceae bacterium]